MMITEFISQYAAVEMDKLERMREKGVDPHAEEKAPPKSRGSMRGKVDSKLAGTARDKMIS
jgi:hypothetical protein